MMTSSAPAAYRADVTGRASPFGADDGDWIAVTSVVAHATLVAEPDREALLRDAIARSTGIVGAAELERLASRQWEDRDRAPTDAIVILADRIERAGAHHLAATTLDGLLAAATLNAVQQGRIIAKRARLAAKMGRVDEAFDRYSRVDQLARTAHSDELQARAWIGFGAVAQLRGNYPGLVEHCRRAAPLADRTGLRQLVRTAHSGLMIAASMAHHFDEALHHGWAVYQAALGDPVEEAEVLQNLGQVLLDSGHTAAAGAAFAAVVSRELPAWIILPALGGLALASAGSDQEARVSWATGEVLRVEAAAVPRHPLAMTLIECATALAQIGRVSEAEQCRAKALRLARAHDFHEVAYRAETLDPSARPAATRRPTALDQSAVSVVREVAWLDPKQLPEHIVLASAAL